MSELRIRVRSMDCRSCVRAVTSRLRDVPGVHMVTADVDGGLVVLTGTMTRAEVLAALEHSSYGAEIVDD